MLARMDAHVEAVRTGKTESLLMHGVLTTGEVLWLNSSFDAASSTSGRDYLSQEEFVAAVVELAEVPPSHQDLLHAFDVADVDRSGGIDREEYLLLYAKVKRGEVEGISNKTAAIYDALTDQDRLSLKEAFDKRKSRMPPEYEDYHLEKKDFLLTGDIRAWVGSRT